MIRVGALAVLGFVAGALVGFAWGQASRSRVSSAVTTGVDHGKITVTIDAAQIAAGGVGNYIASKL